MEIILGNKEDQEINSTVGDKDKEINNRVGEAKVNSKVEIGISQVNKIHGEAKDKANSSQAGDKEISSKVGEDKVSSNRVGEANKVKAMVTATVMDMANMVKDINNRVGEVKVNNKTHGEDKDKVNSSQAGDKEINSKVGDNKVNSNRVGEEIQLKTITTTKQLIQLNHFSRHLAKNTKL